MVLHLRNIFKYQHDSNNKKVFK